MKSAAIWSLGRIGGAAGIAGKLSIVVGITAIASAEPADMLTATWGAGPQANKAKTEIELSRCFKYPVP